MVRTRLPATRSKEDSASEMGEQPKRKRMRKLSDLPLPECYTLKGVAWVCGQGDMGQLGLHLDDTAMEIKFPTKLKSITNIVDICAGGLHSVLLTCDGRVYTCGCNDEGALGRISDESEDEPKEVLLPGKAIKISAGDSHSACILENGVVYAWGSFRNSHGNMGLTIEGTQRLPCNILPNKQCCQIASGADHLVMLSCKGEVYTVGSGEQGQLGRVTLRTAAGKTRRELRELLSPKAIVFRKKVPIENIWATTYGTFIRDARKDIIFAFGLNNFHQLTYAKATNIIPCPIKTNLNNVRDIAGGMHHTLVLDQEGTCYVIGRCEYGRLGLGNLSEDVKCLEPLKTLTEKIVSISCGDRQSFAISAEGKLYSWGMGTTLQLGNGTEDDILQPTLITNEEIEGKFFIRAAIGGQHSLFLVKE